MSSVNVEIEVPAHIRDKIRDLQEVASQGLSGCMGALNSEDQKATGAESRANAVIARLENEIEQLEKDAREKQEAYDKQVREEAEAQAQGKPYVGQYVTPPNELREKAAEKKKILEEIKEESANLNKRIKSFHSWGNQFVDAFKKIASGTDGDDGQMVNVLEKIIAALDKYVSDNFSSNSRTAYAARAAQRDAEIAAQHRRLQEAAMRHHELGDD